MRAPKSDGMWMVVIKQGGIAEAALNVTNRTFDSKTKILYFLVVNWYQA